MRRRCAMLFVCLRIPERIPKSNHHGFLARATHSTEMPIYPDIVRQLMPYNSHFVPIQPRIPLLSFFSFLSFLFLPFFSFSLRSAVDPRHRPAPVNALLGWRTRSCLVLPRPGLLLPWLSPAPGLLACCPAQLQHAGRIDTAILVSHGSSQP